MVGCISDEDDLLSHESEEYNGTLNIYWNTSLSIIVCGTFITSLLLLYTLYEVNRRQQLAYQGDEVAARRLILPCYKPLLTMLAIIFFILAVISCVAYRYHQLLYLYYIIIIITLSLFNIIILALILNIFIILLNYYNFMDYVYLGYILLVHLYYYKNLYQIIALKNVHVLYYHGGYYVFHYGVDHYFQKVVQKQEELK